METIIFLPSRSSPVLSHHDTEKADRRLKAATNNARLDYLAPMSSKQSQRLLKALNAYQWNK